MAFDNLKRTVIDQGFCTLCGACEAACPVNAIKISKGNPKSIYDCSKYLDRCSICYDVCPHTQELLVETPSLGCYRKVLLCQAMEPGNRKNGRGGVITSLLTYALEKGVIDSVVFSGAKPEMPLELKPLVSSVPDDLLSSVVEVEFFPSAIAEAFSSAVREYGKKSIAFVGVPCHVLALRKLEAWQHRLVDNLKIVVGLFCLWTFSSSKLLQYLSATYNIEASEIQRIALAREYLVHTKEGVVRIPLQKIMPNVLSGCRSCIDFSSELADISVGGASPLEGWSTVIIRSKTGEEFFNDAVRHGVVRTMPIEREPDVFPGIIQMATSKRRFALGEIRKRKRSGKPIPPVMDHFLMFVPREIATLADLKVRDIMTEDVVTLTPEITVDQLLDIMMKHLHRSYPVVNEHKELTAIASFEDITKVPKEKRNEVLVEDIARKDIIMAKPNDSVLRALKKMIKHEIECIVVVDRKNPKKIRGVLTTRDITRELIKHA